MALPPIYSPNSSPIDNAIKLSLSAIDFSAFGTSVLTRGAKGIYYWAQAASQTVNYAASLRMLLRNYSNSLVNYSYTGTFNGPITLKSVTINFLISTANLTSGGVTVSKTTFPANNTVTAPTVVDMLPSAALAVAFQTDLYQTVLTPANTNIECLATDLLTTEAIIVTPASSTFRLYGMTLNFNYNI